MADIRASLKLDTRQAESSVKSLGKSLAGLVSIGALVALGKQAVATANNFQVLNNRLRAVTKSNKEFVQAQKDVNDIADRTRSSLNATADLYASITIASEDLGISQGKVASITETFSKTLKISGADTGAAAGAMVQFGQALASGVLRGDEFNSINETNTVFMGKFAEILGVSRGKLRELAAEGVLTADIMADVALAMAPDVNEEYGKTTATVAEQMTKLGNEFQRLLQKLEDATGVFSLLTKGIGAMADALGNLDKHMGTIKVVAIAAGTALLFFLNPVGAVAAGIGVLSRFIASLVLRTGALGRVFTQLTINFKNFTSVFKSMTKDFFGFGAGVVQSSAVLQKLASTIGSGAIAVGKWASGIAGAIGLTHLFKEEVDELNNTGFVGPTRPQDIGPPLPPEMQEERDDAEEKKKEAAAEAEAKRIREKLRLAEQAKKLEKEAEKARTKFSNLITKDKKTLEAMLGIEQADLEAKIEKLELQGELIGLTKEEKELMTGMAEVEQDRADAIKDVMKLTLSKDVAKNLEMQMAKIAEINELYDEQKEKIRAIIEENIAKAADIGLRIKEGLDQAGIGDFMTTLADGFVNAVKMFEDSLATAIVNGKADFSALGDFIKQTLAKAMVQKFISGPIMAMFGLAKGGPANAGQPYIIGEEGPEVFVPKTNGTVLPNSVLQGGGAGQGMAIGGGTTVNYNISAVDAKSFKRLVSEDPEFIFNVSQAGARRVPG